MTSTMLKVSASSAELLSQTPWPIPVRTTTTILKTKTKSIVEPHSSTTGILVQVGRRAIFTKERVERSVKMPGRIVGIWEFELDMVE